MKLKLLGLILIFFTLAFTSEKKTILFYGDSLTAGYGLSKEQAFPAVIDRKLNSNADQYKIINAGLSGETTAGGLNRLDWILKEPVDIFILELGANDGLRGLPLAQTESNLQQIIDKVKEKNPNVEIIVAGMMVPPNLGEDYTDNFRSIFPRIAKKNNASLIPFLLQGVAGDENLNLADGIHPNVEGHKIVANNVLEVIRPLL
ncbi:arylesterase [Fulvivirga lutimaris]|uniref:arylesterase n=1 Tax=Fulvivirga lutimaris TaxID=1819566 RepID=UPI0012BD39A8|nr:arylesterase [Fulvivirga lutimaris]MTI38910.1 arylesterase [Fulvivirga lutimaris]